MTGTTAASFNGNIVGGGKDLTVTNQYRAIQVADTDEFLAIGQPRVDNQHRRVYPDGIKARYGVPRLNYPQLLDFRTGINIVGAMGDEHVVELKDRTLTVQSLPMPGEGTMEGQYGTATVDFFDRYRYPVGWDSSLWGVPSPFNNLNSQGVRVHYPDPFIPTGTVMTKWGDTMVDFRIRNVYPEGSAATAIGSTPGYFRERMRVTRSAARTSLGCALRPVTMRWVCGGFAAMRASSSLTSSRLIRPTVVSCKAARY